MDPQDEPDPQESPDCTYGFTPPDPLSPETPRAVRALVMALALGAVATDDLHAAAGLLDSTADESMATRILGLAITVGFFVSYLRGMHGVPPDEGPLLKLLENVRPGRGDGDGGDADARWPARRGLYWTRQALECLGVHAEQTQSVPATVAVCCLAACTAAVLDGQIAEPVADRGLAAILELCLADDSDVPDANAEPPILAGPPQVRADWRPHECVQRVR